MIQNTFCHLPGISAAVERQLWADGITCWEHLPRSTHPKVSPAKLLALGEHLAESAARLKEMQAGYFASRLGIHTLPLPQKGNLAFYLERVK